MQGEGLELGGYLGDISRDVNAGGCSRGCQGDTERLQETSRRLPYKCESLTYGSNGRCGETDLRVPRSAPTYSHPTWVNAALVSGNQKVISISRYIAMAVDSAARACPAPSPAAPLAAVLHAVTGGCSRQLPEGSDRKRCAKWRLFDLYVAKPTEGVPCSPTP